MMYTAIEAPVCHKVCCVCLGASVLPLLQTLCVVAAPQRTQRRRLPLQQRQQQHAAQRLLEQRRRALHPLQARHLLHPQQPGRLHPPCLANHWGLLCTTGHLNSTSIDWHTLCCGEGVW